MTLNHSLVQKIGNAIKEVSRNKGSTWWYTPHMAAASRAITERIPLADILFEFRDSRLLNFLQARVRELPKIGHGDQTITLILFGIPNVGKFSPANSLHQIGRISAADIQNVACTEKVKKWAYRDVRWFPEEGLSSSESLAKTVLDEMPCRAQLSSSEKVSAEKTKIAPQALLRGVAQVSNADAGHLGNATVPCTGDGSTWNSIEEINSDKSIDRGRPSLALRSSSCRSGVQEPEVGSSYVDRSLEHNSSLVVCSSSALEAKAVILVHPLLQTNRYRT
ncbi:hypothetical protein CQW23_31430 [Capsicum baccatum]|uniref:Uncharacterized protein n=1 Tax=Capsicum baccatum TaxID=33114 RepID=A0A2G2V7Q5_CAPBA|nr:hypothetical protein CQW23_31430 [Capsicum baccatum]